MYLMFLLLCFNIVFDSQSNETTIRWNVTFDHAINISAAVKIVVLRVQFYNEWGS